MVAERPALLGEEIVVLLVRPLIPEQPLAAAPAHLRIDDPHKGWSDRDHAVMYATASLAATTQPVSSRRNSPTGRPVSRSTPRMARVRSFGSGALRANQDRS